MRRAGIGIGTLVLGLGPWLGFVHQAPVAQAEQSSWLPAAAQRFDASRPTQHVRPAVVRRFAGSGCTCQTVEVNADNFVRDADIRTGDARVLNVNVTYVSPEFAQSGDAAIDVAQDAEATSGDAIAGQILSIAARSARGGCTHVVVHATNDVADSELRSGDARATNRNFVLLDPAVDRSQVDINVDQHASAHSGATIAGQLLGVVGGGGPCGGVDVQASNNVSNVELQTGESRIDNGNTITQCETAGCAKELLRLLRRQHLDAVQMCSADGCRLVSAKELKEMIKASEAADESNDPAADPPRKGKHHKGEPTPTPADDPGLTDSSTSGAVEASPTPTPTPEGGDFSNQSAMGADVPPG
jgi:hypothetical protein